jgi:hypothetical protein
LAVREAFSPCAISVPHTRQRAASALTRVPQVGQILVEVAFLSGVIPCFHLPDTNRGIWVTMGSDPGDYTSLPGIVNHPY